MSVNKIRELRTNKGISREKLAELAGCGYATVWRYENTENREGLKATILHKIATALDCTVADLIGEPSQKLRTTEIVPVPVLSPEMTACCGDGIPFSDITTEPEEYTYLPKQELRYYDDIRKPFAIYADGDSMKGFAIPSGSVVTINPAEPVGNFDVALVCYFGKLALKKVQFMPDKSVNLLCSDGDNIYIPPENNISELFNIIGKVINVSHKPKHGF